MISLPGHLYVTSIAVSLCWEAELMWWVRSENHGKTPSKDLHSAGQGNLALEIRVF